jgi:hypothetical protein
VGTISLSGGCFRQGRLMKLQLNFIDVPSAIIPGEIILNQIISKEKKAIKPINQIISDPRGNFFSNIGQYSHSIT